MGRPSSFTEKAAKEICDRLSIGQSLREICLSKEMPGIVTVFRWIHSNEVFRKQYARAREAQADYLFDEIVQIADDGTNDWMTRNAGSDDETEAANHEHINRSRLRIDARKWVASKLAPKKYGEKLTMDGDGEGGPIGIAVMEATDEMRARALAAFMAKTKGRLP